MERDCKLLAVNVVSTELIAHGSKELGDVRLNPIPYTLLVLFTISRHSLSSMDNLLFTGRKYFI